MTSTAQNERQPMEKSHALKIKRILRYLAITLLTVLLAMEIIVLGIRLMGGEKAVSDLPVYLMEITSDSMYPRLKQGDCVLNTDTPFAELQEGDLITFYYGGKLVTHEILTINANHTVTTKGLMNAYDDGEISEAYYVGKVLCRLPFLSLFLRLTDDVVGQILVLTMIVLLCWGYPMASTVAERWYRQNRYKERVAGRQCRDREARSRHMKELWEQKQQEENDVDDPELERIDDVFIEVQEVFEEIPELDELDKDRFH